MRYLSQCPNCQVTYQLSLMEMNISRGMVRCACCQHAFDAYSCFIHDPDYQPPPVTNYLTEVLFTQQESSQQHLWQNSSPLHSSEQSQYVQQFMEQGVQDSRLDLYTYLNYIDTLSPIHSEQENNIVATSASLPTPQQVKFHRKKRRLNYYLMWGMINLSLICLFILQIIFWNR